VVQTHGTIACCGSRGNVLAGFQVSVSSTLPLRSQPTGRFVRQTTDGPGLGRILAQQLITVPHLEVGKVEAWRHGAADQGKCALCRYFSPEPAPCGDYCLERLSCSDVGTESQGVIFPPGSYDMHCQ